MKLRLALFEMSALDRTASVLSEWNVPGDALSMLTSISTGTSRFSLVTSSQNAKGDLCLVSKRYSLMAFTSAIMQHVRLAILKHQICLFGLLSPRTSDLMW